MRAESDSPLKQLIPLIKATGDFQVLDHIENCLGRVAIHIPKEQATPDVPQMKAINSAAEFGRLMGKVHQALADDKLSRPERDQICKIGWGVVSAIMQIIVSCE